MFRTSKCSSSGRLVHAVLWYVFLSCIHISSLVDGRMCWSTSCHRPDCCLYGCRKEIPQNCMSSWGWTLGCSKYVEDTIIKLKHLCKKYAFCWLLLHWCIIMDGSKNVKSGNAVPLKPKYSLRESASAILSLKLTQYPQKRKLLQQQACVLILCSVIVWTARWSYQT